MSLVLYICQKVTLGNVNGEWVLGKVMGHALVLEHVEKCHVIYGQLLNLLFSALEVIAAMSDVGQAAQGR